MQRTISAAIIILMLSILVTPLFTTSVNAAEKTCVTYFTGIGCPHCAKADPVVLDEKLEGNENLVVIEYEIYQLSQNAPLLEKYDTEYNTGLGVPLLIFDSKTSLRGDRPIINDIDTNLKSKSGNKCPTLEGKTDFSELDLNSLEGKPKIWTKDRILIKNENRTTSNEILHRLLTEDPESVLNEIENKEIEAKNVPLSGDSVAFDKAAEVNGWEILWERRENQKENGQSSFNWTGIAMIAVLVLIGLIIAYGGLKR